MTDEKCAWEINLTGKSKREKKKIELKVMEKIELKTIKISFASDSRISGSLTLAL